MAIYKGCAYDPNKIKIVWDFLVEAFKKGSVTLENVYDLTLPEKAVIYNHLVKHRTCMVIYRLETNYYVTCFGMKSKRQVTAALTDVMFYDCFPFMDTFKQETNLNKTGESL